MKWGSVLKYSIKRGQGLIFLTSAKRYIDYTKGYVYFLLRAMERQRKTFLSMWFNLYQYLHY